MIRRYLTQGNALVGNALGGVIVRALAGAGLVQAAGMLATFVVGILLARGLGVTGYGQYGMAFAIIALASVPGEFGLPRLVLRETAAATVSANSVLQLAVVDWTTRRAIFASVVAIALVVAGLFLFLGRSHPAVSFALLVGLPLVPLGALVAIRSNALMGRHEVIKSQVPTLLMRPLLFTAFLLLLFWIHPNVGAAEAMASNVVTALAALLLVDHWFGSRLPRVKEQLLPTSEDWTSSSVAMALMDGFRVLQGQIGILLLGFLVGADQAGVFRVAVAAALMVSVPMTLFETVFSPVFARLFTAREFDRLQQLATRSAQVSTLTMLCFSMPIFVWGHELIEWIFGQEYLPAYAALAALCGGQIISAAFGMNASILMMTGHEKHLTRAVMLGVIANILLVALLVPRWGAFGAALASVGYVITWNVIGWRDARRLLGVDSSLLGGTRHISHGHS